MMPIAQHFDYDQVALAAHRPTGALSYFASSLCEGVIFYPAAMEMERIKIATLSLIASTWTQFQYLHRDHHKEVCLKMFQRILSEVSHCVAF